MLISLNWIRDFVDLPADLDVRAFAEQFTCTTAELEGTEHVTCDAKGLIAAEITDVKPIPDTASLFAARINTGTKQYDSVTIAEGLQPGDKVIYAPPGSTLPKIGKVTERKVKGHTSAGMVVPGDALGLEPVGQRAVWLPPNTETSRTIDMTLFEDWILEVDNKSITHRPDLWGHYGIAREVAAMCSLPLKPYDVVAFEELTSLDKPEIPITIDDPQAAPRYSALRFKGVTPQPAPLWMQVRLAHVGTRPIDVLVDLTNYIMAELGQPMHAFDGTAIDCIEVAFAKTGEKFATLDGEKRTMPERALMIQCHRKSVALAGIMGGLDTEITAETKSLLLESANFEPATIRRCATALGHRTDASTRFEKSLDPANTVLAIQRFIHLAQPELPELKLTSKLSDAFPNPPAPITIELDPLFLNRYVGREVPIEQVKAILEALEFEVKDIDGKLDVTVPSFRATKDIRIEADLIEEVARCIGYGSIEPVLPTVTVRYAEPARMSRFERQTLTLLCGGMGYAEIHGKIWFDNDWLRTLGFDPGATIQLSNPAAAGMEQLQTTLIPDLLAAVDRNRHHDPRFELVEIGSVFPPDRKEEPCEDRHLGLALAAPGRKAAHEDALTRKLKTDLETWLHQQLGLRTTFAATEASTPWEHPIKTATIHVGNTEIGRLTVVPAAGKRAIDEHLTAWSIALAEINLSALAQRTPAVKKMVTVPVYPPVEVDFSVLAAAEQRYAAIEKELARYDHPLLRRLAFVDSYEGGSIPAGQRSFTFRATIADPERTLTDADLQAFRQSFIQHLETNNLTLRS